ncbi:hypothetical protein HELRODRAFT_165081 [Helobdella robusta]|uniref:Uncharacterized protein n=1 Tax=Helobdella robusta TaxID=6412 RepID=T1EW96_HELRO|nr:hypothetical protein HELRODRAFT_165081 [Helobdella robusta]ESN92941.1 hypothetical protein HELRODRAFT_165081 [Helobdella robusta]
MLKKNTRIRQIHEENGRICVEKLSQQQETTNHQNAGTVKKDISGSIAGKQMLPRCAMAMARRLCPKLLGPAAYYNKNSALPNFSVGYIKPRNVPILVTKNACLTKYLRLKVQITFWLGDQASLTL